ncbi:helix-turn-helix transcriptional regulator [Adlercreutzia equolifaciens]|uniref:helix-turn-helix transcriptional regulator n=1 Tax=Adlercreutzia equolifaciens TaxID=446660 RepID=UPI00399CFD78
MSPEMCLRLGRLFGTTPQFWMNMQSKVDIWDSLALHEDEVMAIEPIEIAAIA